MTIKENFFFCKRLPQNTTGEENSRVAFDYIEQEGMEWKNCISVCTDGAAAMVGRYKGVTSTNFSFLNFGEFLKFMFRW